MGWEVCELAEITNVTHMAGAWRDMMEGPIDWLDTLLARRTDTAPVFNFEQQRSLAFTLVPTPCPSDSDSQSNELASLSLSLVVLFFIPEINKSD